MKTKKTTKKTVKNLNKKIAADNRAFAKLPKAKQRVQIAKDVLKQLATGKLRAKRGVYLHSRKPLYKESTPPDTQVCDLLAGLKRCDVCALGGLFVAAVKRADKLSVGDLSAAEDGENASIYRSEMVEYLAPYFLEEELDDIEEAFESFSYPDFNFGVRSAPERMRRIMQNIVDNRGEFRP